MLMLPRSLVDEAKSKIWSINQIKFSFLLYCTGGVEYCHQCALWCLQFILHKIFFWYFPLLLNCLIPTLEFINRSCPAKHKPRPDWRTREWKSFLFKISTISECLYRNSLLTSDLIASSIRPVRLCLYSFRTHLLSPFSHCLISQMHFSI